MKFSYFIAQLFFVLALVQLVISGDEVIENVNKNEVENLKGEPLSKLNLLRMEHNHDDILHL